MLHVWFVYCLSNDADDATFLDAKVAPILGIAAAAAIATATTTTDVVSKANASITLGLAGWRGLGITFFSWP